MKSERYSWDAFDSFMLGTDRVDLTTHRVTAPDGTHFELSFTAMLFLKVLAARPGELVSIREMCESIWGATSESLAGDHAEIAHHFNDDPTNPRYIEYLEGVGYRLLQTVHPGDMPFNAKFSRLFFLELSRRKVFRAAALYCLTAFIALQISDATFAALTLPEVAVPILIVTLIVGFPIVVILSWFLELTSGSLEKDAQSGWFQLMGRRWEVTALVSLFAISAFFALSVSRSISFDTQNVEVGLAVLPFDNLTTDDETDYLAHGISEEVASTLSNFDGILVAAGSETSRFTDDEITVTATAQELDVEFLVEGSLIRKAGQLKVTVKIVSGLTGKNVKAFLFDVDDLSGLSFEIAESIASTVSQSAAFGSSVDQIEGDTNVVYQHYLKGIAGLETATSVQEFRDAQAEIEQAINMGGRFRRAESALCRILFGIHQLSNDIAVTRDAERQCVRAAVMDRPDTDAMSAYGGLLIALGKHREAVRAFQRALKARPLDSNAESGLALALEHIGTRQFRDGSWLDARTSWQRALELYPTPYLIFQIGRLSYLEGDLNQARRVLENGVDSFPDNETIWGQLGFVYIAESRSGEHALKRAKALNQMRSPSSQARGSAYLAYLGDLEKASQIVHDELILTTVDPEAHYWRSLALLRLGDESQVLAALRKALDMGLPQQVAMNDPNLSKYTRLLISEGVGSM